jgi:hypothetical protein
VGIALEDRFGVWGEGVLIRGRLDEEGGGDDGDGELFEERLSAGDESEARLSEGVTKLVNRGKRNRCWSFPSCGERLPSLSRSSPGRASDTFLVRRRVTLDSNRLSTPVRSLLPSSLPISSVTLTSVSVIGGIWLPGAVGFPFDRVPDRTVCSKGERSKRLKVIGADDSEEG